MKHWHREDIFSELIQNGWSSPVKEIDENYYVGEAYSSIKNDKSLHLSFVSDLGEGYTGIESIEELIAIPDQGDRQLLWLNRRRDNKWRIALNSWVNNIDESS